jgi:hypothetical protein
MALPEHVKKQAFDAVGHKETTAMIRAYANDNSWQPFNQSERMQAPARQPSLNTEQIIAKGRDAVSHSETTAQIRLISVNNTDSPMATPNRDNTKAAQQIAQMHQAGRDADSIHHAANKDGFGRE